MDELELEVGGSLTLPLPSLGTAGYVWQHSVEGDVDAVRVSGSRGRPSGTGVGSSTPELVTIEAQAAGRATVRLLQVRPWEVGVAPHAERVLTVQVRPRE